MTTDITELTQREKFEAWVMTQICISKSTLEGLRTVEGYRNSTLSGTDYNRLWSLYQSAASEQVEALEKAPQAPIMPLGLHPDTQKLVTDFCTALAEKLYKAQLKYGYDTDWKQDGWPSQCQAHFHQHIAKGDPRDVAAYCAFMWWHGWSTKPPEGVESRTVTVKLPDYRNTYKSPFADEVEHQVRLALELFSSAAGIKVEDE